jgi:hypothetical protein
VGVLAAMAAPALAPATMPPKTCGPIKVGRTTYLIKADQVPCPFAKAWARKYIVARQHPAGFTCAKLPPSSRIKVYCRRSYHTYFALK